VSRETNLLTTPSGATLEYLLVESGAAEPTTLFVPGLGGGIADTRPLAGAVAGRRGFLHLRGHGRSTAPGPWTYRELADEVAAVADEVGASRALGVSLGAGALCRLLVDEPDRFDRLVFYLPAVVSLPRENDRMAQLARAAAAGDRATVTAMLAEELPAGADGFLESRLAALLRPDLAAGITDLTHQVPVPALAALAAVTAPALVLGCLGDPAHPAAVAEELAGALGNARLHVFDRPAPLWTARAELRGRISGFLNGVAPAG